MNVSFTNADEIDAFFTKTGGQDFINWFNARVGGIDNWGKTSSRAALKIANDSLTHQRFDQLWSADSIQSIFPGKISLLQFVALQSIIINETGGRLTPLTEQVGRDGHPGIAYAFDRILNVKRSYNTLSGNKTCMQCFNDPNYNKAFGTLPLGDKLRNTNDAVWAGEAYPQLKTPTSTNPAITGYVLEADFFKFRGRGFIQTTGRGNYKQLVSFIQSYNGTNPVMLKIKAKWANISPDADVLATISSNADWDELFQNTNSLIPCRAIRTHNVSGGNYLEQLNMANPDTIFNMGLRISGGQNYAKLFQQRVLQVFKAL